MIRIKEWDNVEVNNLKADCVDYIRVVDGKEEHYDIITATVPYWAGYSGGRSTTNIRIMVPRRIEQAMQYRLPAEFIAAELTGSVEEWKRLREENAKLAAEGRLKQTQIDSLLKHAKQRGILSRIFG